MYNVELVRLICRDISNAKGDPQKEQELLSLLPSSEKIRKKCEAE